MIWFPAFSSLFLGVAHSIDAKNRLRIERNFSATSSPYELTVYQVSNGKADAGQKMKRCSLSNPFPRHAG